MLASTDASSGQHASDNAKRSKSGRKEHSDCSAWEERHTATRGVREDDGGRLQRLQEARDEVDGAVESHGVQSQQRVAAVEGDVWRRRVGVAEDGGQHVVTGLEAVRLQRGDDIRPVGQRVYGHSEVVVAGGGGGDLFWRQADDVAHSGLLVCLGREERK